VDRTVNEMGMGQTMQCAPNNETSMFGGIRELTLSEALSDPLIRSVMAADGVDPEELEVMLRDIAQVRAPRPLRDGVRTNRRIRLCYPGTSA